MTETTADGEGRCAYCLEPLPAGEGVVLDPEFDETSVLVHEECQKLWQQDRIAEYTSDRATAWML